VELIAESLKHQGYYGQIGAIDDPVSRSKGITDVLHMNLDLDSVEKWL
jgi:hypothetical protein